MDEHDADHQPAIRPPLVASLKPGVTRLPPQWYRLPFEPGTTVLARDLSRAARAARPLKADPDRERQKRQRIERKHAFAFHPEHLYRDVASEFGLGNPFTKH